MPTLSPDAVCKIFERFRLRRDAQRAYCPFCGGSMEPPCGDVCCGTCLSEMVHKTAAAISEMREEPLCPLP
jgi:hypothetical protein